MGTDFQIQITGHRFYSHKYQKSGMRYEVATSLISGDLVWITGPYEYGKWPDISIFQNSLLSYLTEGKRVEADDVTADPTTASVQLISTKDMKQSTRNSSSGVFWSRFFFTPGAKFSELLPFHRRLQLKMVGQLAMWTHNWMIWNTLSTMATLMNMKVDWSPTMMRTMMGHGLNVDPGLSWMLSLDLIWLMTEP